MQENSDYQIRDLSMEEIIPNTFDNCVVTVFEGHHTLDMPPTMTGLIFKNWLKTKAGIFSKDAHKFLHGKPYGKYFLYEGHEKRFIARFVNEDESLTLEALNLIDGKINDKPYIIIRNLDEEDTLSNVKRYIVSEEEISNDVVALISSMPDEEETTNYTSLSLFTE